MSGVLSKLAPIKKMVAAACGLLALALANGLLHGEAAALANAVLSTATLLGVYQAKNKPAEK